jgi:mRNA-degrading endonuclease RelE of RelBE toxin-antitoxin system
MALRRIYVLPHVVKEIDRLPGNVRQRAREAVITLRQNAEPPNSKRLSFDLGRGRELWRLKLDAWRIIYLVDREAESLYVVGVRRCPPYQYDDLASLAEQTKLLPRRNLHGRPSRSARPRRSWVQGSPWNPFSGSLGAIVAIAATLPTDWKSPPEGEKRPQPLVFRALRGLFSLSRGFAVPGSNGYGQAK